MEKKAIGFLETNGFISIIAALDEMLKSADVTFLGCKGLDGVYTGLVGGDVSSVRDSVEMGVKKAEELGVLISSRVINAIEDELDEKLALTKSKNQDLKIEETNSFLAVDFEIESP